MILPNFLCIGAPKSGTTSLFEILKQHPEIGLSSFKEPHFFDTDANWKKGVDWYEKNYFIGLESKKSIGEFTPSYLGSEICSSRIKKTLNKDVKFIVLLRNPINRSYSHYLHIKRDEYENLSFLDSLEKEEDRLKDYKLNKDDVSFSRFSYKYSSMYSLHLKNYFKEFKKEQFCIVLFDDFVNHRQGVIKRILNFLDVDDNVALNIDIRINPASKARSVHLKKFMLKKSAFRTLLKFMIPSLEFRQMLRNKMHGMNNKASDKISLTKEDKLLCYHNYFKDDINELEKMLNINLKKWKL
jgi:hypothetical protein